MLQSMRDNFKGAAAVILVTLFCIPFIFVGIDALFVTNPETEAVASINDEEITKNELQRAIYLQRQQLLSRLGDKASAQDLSDERLASPVLEQLIRRELLSQLVVQQDFAISQKTLNSLLLEMPQFLTDGRFDQQKYLQVIGGIGHTPSTYQDLVKKDLVFTQLLGAYEKSAFISGKEAQRIASLFEQKRDFEYLTVSKQNMLAQVSIAEPEIAKLYEDNLASYQTEETLSLRYVELKLSDIQSAVDVSEDDVKQAYQDFSRAYKAKIERKASHILVEEKEDGSHTEILAQLKEKLASGENFSALAKLFSEDLGSKENGGDLGYTQGETFPEAFEVALANLEQGQVSDVVETESGFHLIKLTELSSESVPSFADSADRLRDEVARTRAEDEYLDSLTRLRDSSYDMEDITELAESLDLSTQSSKDFSRLGGEGVAALPAVIKAAFAEDVLLDGQLSEVLELNNQHAIIVQRKLHTPARQQTLLEVTEQIKSLLQHQKARDKALEMGQELMAKVKSGVSLKSLADKPALWHSLQGVDRNNRELPPEVLALAFSLAEGAISGVATAEGSYQLVLQKKIHESDNTVKPELAQWLASQFGQRGFSLLEASHRSQAEVLVH